MSLALRALHRAAADSSGDLTAAAAANISTTPEATTAAAAKALGAVAQAEQHVQRTVQRVAQAQGRRAAAAARLEECIATLTDAEDKAHGIVDVAGAISGGVVSSEVGWPDVNL